MVCAPLADTHFSNFFFQFLLSTSRLDCKLAFTLNTSRQMRHQSFTCHVPVSLSSKYGQTTQHTTLPSPKVESMQMHYVASWCIQWRVFSVFLRLAAWVNNAGPFFCTRPALARLTACLVLIVEDSGSVEDPHWLAEAVQWNPIGWQRWRGEPLG